MADIGTKISDLLAKIPEPQREAALVLLTQYGPRLWEIAQEDAWQYLRRLMAGDLMAVVELDSKLSSDEFIAKVKSNTARWEGVAVYNKIRDEIGNEVALRTAAIVASILLALVGL